MGEYLPLISLLVGLFAGAWLTHRARSGMSPLPTLPKKKPEPEEKPLKLPEVRP